MTYFQGVVCIPLEPDAVVLARDDKDRGARDGIAFGDEAARTLTDEDKATSRVVLGQRCWNRHPSGVLGVVEEGDLSRRARAG